MISEEVKNAFYEIFEQQEMQIDGEEEEENDNEDNNGDGSDGHLGNSRRDIVVRETTEGEEEETEPQETVEDQSEDLNDNKYDDLEEEDNREGSKITFTFDYLTQLPCQDHPEELNTHYSPILKRLLCPECIIGFQPKRIEHNAKPIRKCHG
jgi:hypothetical protein